VAKPSRIVDVHQHVNWHGRDDRGLVANMDECGIDQAVLLNWDVTDIEHYHAYEGAFNPARATPEGRSRGLPLSDIVEAVRKPAMALWRSRDWSDLGTQVA